MGVIDGDPCSECGCSQYEAYEVFIMCGGDSGEEEESEEQYFCTGCNTCYQGDEIDWSFWR